MSAALPFGIDITEIPGFDDLSDPQGILLETAQLAASLYGSREAFLLVGGSTLGNLAAIGAYAARGDKVLADFYCHRSVQNAAELFGLELVSVTSGVDESSGVPHSIAPSDVEAALLAHPDIRLVVITSPSYEGVISDISPIAEIVHRAGALLHIDCAHGAHLGLCDCLAGSQGADFASGQGTYFPKSPISLGADTVVMSLHKTLPALTQCSLLHICSERVDGAAVRKMLGILQTSSPSYVLMASMDSCLRLLEQDAERLFKKYKENLTYFYDRVSGLKNISLLRRAEGIFDTDPGRLVIITPPGFLSGGGAELAGILRDKYKMETERTEGRYIIALTSICDTLDGFTRLADALTEIDEGAPV